MQYSELKINIVSMFIRVHVCSSLRTRDHLTLCSLHRDHNPQLHPIPERLHYGLTVWGQSTMGNASCSVALCRGAQTSLNSSAKVGHRFNKRIKSQFPLCSCCTLLERRDQLKCQRFLRDTVGALFNVLKESSLGASVTKWCCLK